MLDRHVDIRGGRLNVHILIHKATRTKEYEKVAGTKMAVGPILPPFKTIEE